jgi:hypothetical protein
VSIRQVDINGSVSATAETLVASIAGICTQAAPVPAVVKKAIIHMGKPTILSTSSGVLCTIDVTTQTPELTNGMEREVSKYANDGSTLKTFFLT